MGFRNKCDWRSTETRQLQGRGPVWTESVRGVSGSWRLLESSQAARSGCSGQMLHLLACESAACSSAPCLERRSHSCPQLMEKSFAAIQMGELALGCDHGEKFFFNLGSEFLPLDRCLPQSCCTSLYTSGISCPLLFSVSSGINYGLRQTTVSSGQLRLGAPWGDPAIIRGSLLDGWPMTWGTGLTP